MGYSSYLVCDFRVLPERKNNFLKAVENAKKQWEETKNPKLEFVETYFDDEFLLLDDGYFEYFEHYGKWYNDEEFAKFLTPYVRGRLIYEGEDGNKWGYYFDGDGCCYDIQYVEAIGNIPMFRAPKEEQIKIE